MKKIIILVAILFIAVQAMAQKIQNGERLTISRPVDHDLYLMGGTATVNAPVHGDLVIGAGTVALNDTVTGDVIIAGGKLTINGCVLGDVRGAGGEVYLNGVVLEDIAMSAGNITSGSNSIVNGDMYLGAGTTVLGGTIKGNLTCRSGDAQLQGTVEGDMDCRSGTLLVNGSVRGKATLAAEKISIGDQAAFYQHVSYWQKNKMLDFKQSIKQGSATYEPALETSSGKWQYIGFATLSFMIWYIGAVFVFIFLMQYFFGKTLKRAADNAFNFTMQSIGRGLLFLAGVPAVAFILMLTVVGLPLGLLVMVVYAILLVMAGIISSVVIANWIGNKRQSKWGTGMLSLVALVIFVLLKLITSVPVFGWIIMLVICCLAFGSLVTDIYNLRRKNQVQVK